MNENQKAAVDALIAGASKEEADVLLGCLWRGLERAKSNTREQLARAVMSGEVGSVAGYRRQINALEEFDKALEQHPYAVQRAAELTEESRKQRSERLHDLLGTLFR